MVDLAEIQAAYYMVAATGVLIAAIFYILNLRISQKNQELMLKAQQQTLDTRQAQMFMSIYNQSTTKEFNKALNKYMESQWSSWDDFRELWKNAEFREAFNVVGVYYEGLGVLVREGLLDVRMVALLICGMTRMYWEKLSPIVEEGRMVTGYSRFASESEYLYNSLMTYLDEHPELRTEFKSFP